MKSLRGAVGGGGGVKAVQQKFIVELLFSVGAVVSKDSPIFIQLFEESPAVGKYSKHGSTETRYSKYGITDGAQNLVTACECAAVSHVAVTESLCITLVQWGREPFLEVGP